MDQDCKSPEILFEVTIAFNVINYAPATLCLAIGRSRIVGSGPWELHGDWKFVGWAYVRHITTRVFICEVPSRHALHVGKLILLQPHPLIWKKNILESAWIFLCPLRCPAIRPFLWWLHGQFALEFQSLGNWNMVHSFYIPGILRIPKLRNTNICQ